ncbi:hypothetical protein C6H65_22100 [Photorhabdus luminescens]|nr:hypothetical protein C6H65_22100 [Photorhabdus luminescens]
MTGEKITRIVSPSPKANERFGASVSMSAAGDCLAVGGGVIKSVCIQAGRVGGIQVLLLCLRLMEIDIVVLHGISV